MEFIKEIFEQIYDVRGLVQTAGYIGLVIIIFSETGLLAGFFFPGDSLLVTAGLFAAKGDMDIWILNLLLIPAAVIGDSVGYWIGHKVGPHLFKKSSFSFSERIILLKRTNFTRNTAV